MTVTVDQYKGYVKTLFKDGAQIRDDLEGVGDKCIGRLHAVIGMVGEYNEYKFSTSSVHALEEIGDLYFYAVALQQNLIYEPPFEDPIKLSMEETLNELLDLCKKEVIYAQELSAEKVEYFHNLAYHAFADIVSLIDANGWTVAKIIESNIQKLAKRYPGLGYSNEAAAARADKQESEGE